MDNAYQILAQVLPRARSEEELVAMAAELGEPPSVGQPPAATISPSSAGLQGMPKSPLAPAGGVMVPPMTMGESRTAPRLGDALLGV